MRTRTIPLYVVLLPVVVFIMVAAAYATLLTMDNPSKANPPFPVQFTSCEVTNAPYSGAITLTSVVKPQDVEQLLATCNEKEVRL